MLCGRTLAGWVLGWTTLVAGLAPASGQAASPWQTNRPYKAVVIGGSISRYFAGNFGEFLHHGCKSLEVINRGEVGAGGAKLKKNLQKEVIAKPEVLGPMQGGKGWILFQGGLNSVMQIKGTVKQLAELFALAHSADLQVVALSLTPWGSDGDSRFAGWKGLQLHEATAAVSRFLLKQAGKDTIFGGSPAKFMAEELPDIAVDLWNSDLRDSGAALRPESQLAATFATSPYRRDVDRRDSWIAAARAVPRHFLAKTYQGFDHTHPNGQGHRLMAALVCQQAPQEWQCDCDRIRRARFKGKVVDG
jgi:hypothetical protein